MNCDFCEVILEADANFCSRCGNATGQRAFDASTPHVRITSAKSVFSAEIMRALATRIGRARLRLAKWVFGQAGSYLSLNRPPLVRSARFTELCEESERT